MQDHENLSISEIGSQSMWVACGIYLFCQG